MSFVTLLFIGGNIPTATVLTAYAGAGSSFWMDARPRRGGGDIIPSGNSSTFSSNSPITSSNAFFAGVGNSGSDPVISSSCFRYWSSGRHSKPYLLLLYENSRSDSWGTSKIWKVFCAKSTLKRSWIVYYNCCLCSSDRPLKCTSLPWGATRTISGETVDFIKDLRFLMPFRRHIRWS